MRASCDSFYVRRPSGAGLYAKNSDRPALECQPVRRASAASHPPGSRLRCLYIEIDQVERTHAFVGAGPHWIWGLEHGVNERGVAIGNHTIFTKEPAAEVGLQGMDLVRLGLERGDSAIEAARVIGALVEEYGQGGSGYQDLVFAYNSSFLICDAKEAWLLEAVGRHWALKPAGAGLAASNHAQIGADWEHLSSDCVAHAVQQGWWSEAETERFDFSKAYRDDDAVPAFIWSGRFATTCAALARPAPPSSFDQARQVLRDHYQTPGSFRPIAAPDDEHYFSVCEHADPVGTTTASMIVNLEGQGEGDRNAPLVCWTALGSPCISVYLPLFLDADLPEPLVCGAEAFSKDSAWWRFRKLLDAVEEDFETRGPYVAAEWRPLEDEFLRKAEELSSRLTAMSTPERRRASSELVAQVWSVVDRKLDEIVTAVRNF